MQIFSLVILLVLFGAASPAMATTYFVDSNKAGYNGASAPSGACATADAAAGTSSGAAWCTWQKVHAMESSIVAGDTVQFQGGSTWTEQFSILTMHGTSGSRLTFTTYGTGRAIIDGGSTRNDCFDLINFGNNQSYITINNFECKNTVRNGITIQENNVAAAGIIVQNCYIHNTGPGAFPGATVGPNTSGNCVAAASAVGGVANGCDDGNYRNQLDFEANACSGTTASCAAGVQFLNNIVTNSGGHNSVEVHHDTGNPQVIGNTVGPGCPHYCIDFKGVVGALAKSNIITSGVPLFLYPGCLYTEDTWQDGETITFANNICYGSYTGIQIETGGSCVSPGTTCNINAKIYNNTVYAMVGSVPSGFGFTGNSTNVMIMTSCHPGYALDVQNNIFDGGNISINQTNCGTLTYDYNDTGGVQGNTSKNVTPGAHDKSNVDPKFVDAMHADFDLYSTSTLIGAANALSFGSNIGASQNVMSVGSTGVTSHGAGPF